METVSTPPCTLAYLQFVRQIDRHTDIRTTQHTHRQLVSTCTQAVTLQHTQYITGDRDRSGYNRTDSSRPEYSGNRDHFNHHGQDRAGSERGERPHPTRGTERGDYQRYVSTSKLSQR
jgi:hypothetical protein